MTLVEGGGDYPPKRIHGESWLRAATFGSLRWVSNSLRRTSMKDSNIAIPPLPPGLAHSVSPTVLSTWSEASVFSQSTGYEEKVRGDRMLRERKGEITAKIFLRFTENSKLQKRRRKNSQLFPREWTARNRCINHGDEVTKQTPAALI